MQDITSFVLMLLFEPKIFFIELAAIIVMLLLILIFFTGLKSYGGASGLLKNFGKPKLKILVLFVPL